MAPLGKHAFERLEVLVTAKAYPSVSIKYREAVCVAGIRLDTDRPHWVRLFPVQFRDLPEEQQFAKYQVIRLRAQQHSTDPRRETWRPEFDSIEPVGEPLPSGGDWPLRRRFVGPLLGPTMCELHHGRSDGRDGPSLGIVRPALVQGIRVSQEREWTSGQLGTVGQQNLLTRKTTLVKPQHAFNYRYLCEHPRCKGHDQKIVDWELGESYRKWPYSDAELVRRIRGKWLDYMCGAGREPLFFVGDQHRRPGKFMVLGTFFPEIVSNRHQLALELSLNST